MIKFCSTRIPTKKYLKTFVRKFLLMAKKEKYIFLLINKVVFMNFPKG